MTEHHEGDQADGPTLLQAVHDAVAGMRQAYLERSPAERCACLVPGCVCPDAPPPL